MLNPELKLNPNLFDEDVEQKPIRDGYGEGLVLAGMPIRTWLRFALI